MRRKSRPERNDKNPVVDKRPQKTSRNTLQKTLQFESVLLDRNHVSLLKKQQYFFIGNHSAVKICEWTRKSLRGENFCYKQQFYGIRSHMCCQLSVTVSFCQNKCVFCWRDMAYTSGTSMEDLDQGMVDSAEEIIERSVIAQRKLLEGYAGYDKHDTKKLKESREPMHYAISLTGEGTLYPHLAELILGLHKRGKTTFLVSNGLYPERFEELEKKGALPTQLYISLDAPNKRQFEEIDNPQVPDAWEKLSNTMRLLRKFRDKTRTALRITAIKGLNMDDIDGYAKIIRDADPLFVEIKSYMWVGSSRERLRIENMPRHEETREFSERIGKACGYKIIDEKKESRVVLLAKDDFPGRIMEF